jgi:hypothetical protein
MRKDKSRHPWNELEEWAFEEIRTKLASVHVASDAAAPMCLADIVGRKLHITYEVRSGAGKRMCFERGSFWFSLTSIQPCEIGDVRSIVFGVAPHVARIKSVGKIVLTAVTYEPNGDESTQALVKLSCNTFDQSTLKYFLGVVPTSIHVLWC